MIVFKGTKYYSLPEAAKIAGVPYTTFFRWATKDRGFDQVKFDLVQDSRSKRYYVAAPSIEELTTYLQQHVAVVERIQTCRTPVRILSSPVAK